MSFTTIAGGTPRLKIRPAIAPSALAKPALSKSTNLSARVPLKKKIHEQIEQKKALADMIVGSGEQWLTELNLDQLRQLLTLDKERMITL